MLVTEEGAALFVGTSCPEEQPVNNAAVSRLAASGADCFFYIWLMHGSSPFKFLSFAIYFSIFPVYMQAKFVHIFPAQSLPVRKSFQGRLIRDALLDGIILWPALI